MTDKEFDLLKTYMQETNNEMRHNEDMREKVSSIILSLAILISGFVIQQKLADYTIILSIFIIILGLFGAGMTKKLYSIHQFGQQRLNEWYEYLKIQYPDQQIFIYRQIADDKTKKRFPILSKIRHNTFWVILNLIISCIGVILLTLSLLK